MGKTTGIQWCDSSQNPQMGCEGCEMIKGARKETPGCYAANMTARYAGRNGWSNSFAEPKIFMERIPEMLKWNDLTGGERKDKTWLNKLPRIVFLNDMGDTFSNGMPKDWFAPVQEQIKDSPHQYLVLSKFPKRFVGFSERFPLAQNIWAGTSVTSNKTKFRVKDLQKVKNARIKWLSVEPLWDNVIFDDLTGIDWVVVGGESGRHPAPCRIEWIESIVEQCCKNNIPVFVKQLGTVLAKQMGLKDKSGGDWNEWSSHLQIREMPKM